MNYPAQMHNIEKAIKNAMHKISDSSMESILIHSIMKVHFQFNDLILYPSIAHTDDFLSTLSEPLPRVLPSQWCCPAL